MTPQALNYISGRLRDAGLNYHYIRYNHGAAGPVYPYYVGSYKENDAVAEDGGQEATITVTGWTRGEWLDLEQDKAKIKALFPVVGHAVVLTGSGLVVSYVRAQPIPTGDPDLKRIDITLHAIEWSE